LAQNPDITHNPIGCPERAAFSVVRLRII